jgi:hypothetical protein
VACPFFHPTERFEDGIWLQPPRLPLGDPCHGQCIAGFDAPNQPGIDDIRKLCNIGYARGRCPRFPASFEGADAIRFSITGDEGETLSLVCIFEKDYGPFRHMALSYDRVAARFTTPMESRIQEAQARMFVDSYLNRRVKA